IISWTTSPGRKRMSAKTSTEMPKTVGTSSSSRRSTYFPIRTLSPPARFARTAVGDGGGAPPAPAVPYPRPRPLLVEPGVLQAVAPRGRALRVALHVTPDRLGDGVDADPDVRQVGEEDALGVEVDLLPLGHVDRRAPLDEQVVELVVLVPLQLAGVQAIDIP